MYNIYGHKHNCLRFDKIYIIFDVLGRCAIHDIVVKRQCSKIINLPIFFFFSKMKFIRLLQWILQF